MGKWERLAWLLRLGGASIAAALATRGVDWRELLLALATAALTWPSKYPKDQWSPEYRAWRLGRPPPGFEDPPTAPPPTETMPKRLGDEDDTPPAKWRDRNKK